MEHFSPNSGFVLASENSRDSIYDQNVPGTPVFYTLRAALSPESHLVPHSPALSGISRGSVAPSPGTWSPGLHSAVPSPGTWSPGIQPPLTPTTTPMTPAHLLNHQWNGYLSSFVPAEELQNRLREIYSSGSGSPAAIVPGSPAGLVPGSPEYFTPCGSAGVISRPPFDPLTSVSGSPFQQSTPTNSRTIDSKLEYPCSSLESQNRNLITPKRNTNMTNVLRMNNSNVINSPGVHTPKMNTPKMNTPKENTSKENTSRMNTPKMNTPKENISKMNTPKENTPKMNIPTNTINTPRMSRDFLNTSSRTLVTNDCLLTANNSSLNSSLLNVQSTENLGEDTLNESETQTTQNFVSSLFGSRVNLSTPFKQSTQTPLPFAAPTPTPTTPILSPRIPFMTPRLRTVGTSIIQPPGSSPGTPILATSTPTATSARSSRTPRMALSSSAKRSGSSSIGRFASDKDSVFSCNSKAFMTSTPSTKRLSTFSGVPGSAPSRLLALRAISSPGLRRSTQAQKPRPTPSSVKRDLFLNKTHTKEGKTSDEKNSTGYLDFFDSDSDSDAMDDTDALDDTLGDTDAQLDTDMEDANVTIPSERRSECDILTDSSLILDNSVKMESSNSVSMRDKTKFRPKRCLTSSTSKAMTRKSVVSNGSPHLDHGAANRSTFQDSGVAATSPYLDSGAGDQPVPVFRTKRPLNVCPKQRD